MSISSIFKLDKVVTSTPSLDISHILSARAAPEAIVQRFRPAGHETAMHVSVQEERPVIEATTPELDVLLGGVGVGGAALTTGYLYLKEATVVGSTARATLNHQRLAIAEGIIYWTRFVLPHNGQGTVDFVLLANYDTSNNPIVYAGSQALSGNLAAGNHFGCGPVAINGSSLDGITEIEVNSGIQVLSEGSESEVWPTFVGIEQVEPSLTLRTKTAGVPNWSTIGIAGTALNGTTGITFYARKFSADGGRVADGTAEHIKFVGAYGLVLPQETSGDGTQPAMDSLTIALRANSDTGDELAVTTSSAIT